MNPHGDRTALDCPRAIETWVGLIVAVMVLRVLSFRVIAARLGHLEVLNCAGPVGVPRHALAMFWSERKEPLAELGL